MKGVDIMGKKDILFTIGCILIVAAIMLVGVYGVVSKQEEKVEIENTETISVNDEIKEPEEKVEEIEILDNEIGLHPFYFGGSVQDIADLEMDVRFNVNDIDLENKKITFNIYYPDLYDATEVKDLAVGDIIYTNMGEEKAPIEIREIEFNGAFVEINGGLGESEDGLSLILEDEYTYRTIIYNDHSVFSFVSDAEFPLSEDFVIEDYSRGDYGNEGVKATIETLSIFVEELPENYRDFSEICTTLRVVDNKVVSIVRRWIP